MKKLLIVIIASIAMFGSMHASSDSDPQNIMIHLSNYTNDLHSVTMALKIGHMLASHGEEVTMFVDLEGVRLVDKHQPVDLTWGSGMTIKELYDQFIDAGGKVLVCPHCAEAAGIKELRKGATIASMEEKTMYKAFTRADKILDY